MPRPRINKRRPQTGAERQRRYRERRRADGDAEGWVSATATAKGTRPQRWQRVLDQVDAAVRALRDIQSDCEYALNMLPDSKVGTAYESNLESITDADLAPLTDVVAKLRDVWLDDDE